MIMHIISERWNMVPMRMSMKMDGTDSWYLQFWSFLDSRQGEWRLLGESHIQFHWEGFTKVWCSIFCWMDVWFVYCSKGTCGSSSVVMFRFWRSIWYHWREIFWYYLIGYGDMTRLLKESWWVWFFYYVVAQETCFIRSRRRISILSMWLVS